MKQHITKHTVANEVRMMRTHHPGVLAIVEGPSDKTLFLSLVDPNTCKIVVAHGKENAIGAQCMLDTEGFRGVLTLVDADFDHFDGTPSASPHIVRTDLHDMECMMCASPAFSRVLREFSVEERVSDFARSRGCDVLSAITRSAMMIGYLRRISNVQNLRLDFENLTFSKFIERGTLNVTLNKLVQEVKNHSKTPALDSLAIVAQIEGMYSATDDPLQLACGHDILNVLSVGLQHTFASRRAIDVSRETLERSLRLAYSATDFAGTGLYSSIRAWEATNGPFKILISQNRHPTQLAKSTLMYMDKAPC